MFHVVVLFVLIGHIGGLLIPKRWTEVTAWIAEAEQQRDKALANLITPTKSHPPSSAFT